MHSFVAYRLNALDHEIEKVTVYDDRAAVTRRFQVNFKVSIEFSVVISCTIEQTWIIVILGRTKRGRHRTPAEGSRI